MQDKIVLITGGNDGIGKYTAIGLAKMGATIVIACRNSTKAAKAVDEIKAASGNQHVKAIALDLASFASIRQCAVNFQAAYSRLDVLVNNAGLFSSTLQKTTEGFELQFGVNYLGHFLLTHLLLPQLQAAEAPRIVNVASIGHYRGIIDFDNLRGEKGDKAYSGLPSYGRSKLANVLFTREFAKRFPQIICNTLHPGGVRTSIGAKDSAWYVALGWTVLTWFMMSPARGAKTSIYLASSPEAANVTGQYFDENQQIQQPSRLAQDDALAKKLWEWSESVVTGV